MHKSPPPPALVKRDLYAIQKLCAQLAIDYVQAYEAGYIGIGRQSNEDRVTTTNAYSDPTGNLAVGRATNDIRSTNASVATQVESIYRQMVALSVSINRWAH